MAAPRNLFHNPCAACESVASLLRCAAPLTKDMIQMGMTSVVADTGRMKRELVAAPIYPALREGLAALR